MERVLPPVDQRDGMRPWLRGIGWFVLAVTVNVGAALVAFALWDVDLAPLVAPGTLSASLVAGFVAATDAKSRHVGAGLVAGAVVAVLLVVGMLAVVVHDLDVNGVA